MLDVWKKGIATRYHIYLKGDVLSIRCLRGVRVPLVFVICLVLYLDQKYGD